MRRWTAGATFLPAESPSRLFGVALVVFGLCPPPAHAQTPLTNRQRHAEQAGSLLQYGIPAAAFLATWLLDPRDAEIRDAVSEDDGARSESDRHLLLMGGTPRHDLALALGRTWMATEALKYATHETRPNGGPRSFPSGHTSIAFAGAEFIRKEYGWSWAAPAYLAAGFVGWSRVEAKKHYTHDVVAGALVGVLANHDFWHWRSSTSELNVAPLTMDWNGNLVPGFQFELDF